jgi:RNA polymerase sigma-70 factor (ECF subfamily)
MASSKRAHLLDYLRTVVGSSVRTDAELLEDFLARRNESAFEELLLRHGPMVWAVCKRLLWEPSDAEDAFQATFLVLVRKGASVRPRKNVGSWLHGVAFRAAMKARTMNARRRLKETEAAKLSRQAMKAEPGADWQQWLDEELTALPEKYRAPLILCYLEDKTRKEAAELLRWPEGTVAGRLARARALLSERLRRRGIVGTALLTTALDASAPPNHVVAAALQTSRAWLAGSMATMQGVSPRVSALTAEVIKAMALARLRTHVAFALMITLVAAVPLGFSLSGQAEPAREKVEVARNAVAVDRKESVPRSPLFEKLDGKIALEGLEPNTPLHEAL